MRSTRATLALEVAILAGGCCSTCTIPEAEWTLGDPYQTFELFQRAAQCDDENTAYACLSSETKERIPQMDFDQAWAAAGDRIRALGHARLASLVEVTHWRGKAKKATFEYEDITVHFLMVEEIVDGEPRWLFRYPSPYHKEEELRAMMETIAKDAGDCW